MANCVPSTPIGGERDGSAVRALTDVPQDRGSIPRTHKSAHRTGCKDELSSSLHGTSPPGRSVLTSKPSSELCEPTLVSSVGATQSPTSGMTEMLILIKAPRCLADKYQFGCHGSEQEHFAHSLTSDKTSNEKCLFCLLWKWLPGK